MSELLPIAIGLGCQKGVSLATLESAVEAALRPLGEVAVYGLASHGRKADEPALLALAATRAWPLRLYPAEQLAAVAVPQPSAETAEATGTPSVAEAAAILCAGSPELLVAKHRHRGADGKAATVAVARWRRGAGSSG